MAMNPEDEAYAQQLIEKMKLQNQAMNPTAGGSPDQSPGNIGDVLNRGRNANPDVDINSQAILSNVKSSEPPVPAQGAWAECPQCGVMHPPVNPGETCPNKKVEVPEAGIQDEDINKFLAQLKNITVSQIQSKSIKDGNKLFQKLTLELTKFLEGYSEW